MQRGYQLVQLNTSSPISILAKRLEGNRKEEREREHDRKGKKGEKEEGKERKPILYAFIQIFRF
jgi:hypothetical protein